MSKIEAQVINSVLKNKDIGVLFSDSVEDFFRAYGDVWVYVKDYYAKHKQVPDVDIIKSKFDDFDELKVNGATDHYLSELRNDFLKSRLENLIVKAAEAIEGGKPPESVLNNLQGAVTKLNKYSDNVKDIDISDIDRILERVEENRKTIEEKGSIGIPTGFKSIDTAMPSGLASGIHTVLGYSGHGKSFFTALMACKAYEQGYKPLIISLEMSPEEVENRVLAMLGSGIYKIDDFANGELDESMFREWAKATIKSQFHIVGSNGLTEITPNYVQSKIDQYGSQFVVFDYLQLGSDNARSEDKVKRYGNMIFELHNLGISNSLPVMAISSLTDKASTNRNMRPTSEYIAWSRAIEYTSQSIMGVFKDKDSGLINIYSEKNRHGDDFDFYLKTDLSIGKMEEAFDGDS